MGLEEIGKSAASFKKTLDSLFEKIARSCFVAPGFEILSNSKAHIERFSQLTYEMSESAYQSNLINSEGKVTSEMVMQSLLEGLDRDIKPFEVLFC